LPDLFIPIAEDTGTIGKMTDRLLEQAMREARDWPEHISLSINFSPRQISDPNLASRILGLLANVSFPPGRLVIEITESAVVHRLEDAKAVLQALRHSGVRVALDDFGTGYAGLDHLRELELDTIKIDRAFVDQMLTKPEEALALLIKLGCNTGQGFLFGRPEPAAVVTEALHEESRAVGKTGKESTRPHWTA
jgi:EAL domain-containing protein (putative c-di-GMP-specific phosphodiesterase class I)